MCESSTCKKPGILGWTCCRLKERMEEKRESQPPIHGFMRCHKEKVSVRSAVRSMERISIHIAVFSGKWRGIRQGRRCGGSCVWMSWWFGWLRSSQPLLRIKITEAYVKSASIKKQSWTCMQDSYSMLLAYLRIWLFEIAYLLNHMQMCRTVSVCGRMAVHLPERQHIGTAHKCWFVCKLSWKNMKEWITQTPLQVGQDRSAKEKRQEFSTDLAISQDVHLCNKPSIMQVAGFLGPFIVPRGHSQGCWRCQKVSEEIEDIQWYTMMYRYKETACEKCWISMAFYWQCLQLAGTWTGRLWDQIRPGHWRRGLFMPNAWSCLCKHKGEIPNDRIMRKREVLQKCNGHDTVIQDDLPADRKSVLLLLLACRLQKFHCVFTNCSR